MSTDDRTELDEVDGVDDDKLASYLLGLWGC